MLKNKQNIIKCQQKYKQKNKEIIKIYQQEYRQKNPEKKLKHNIQYLKKHGFPLKMDLYSYQFALLSWSKTIKKLGNEICQICYESAEISHHLIYKKTEPKLSLNIHNGIALCKKCHAEVHGWNM